MFTGIITGIGSVVEAGDAVGGRLMRFAFPEGFGPSVAGESIAVDGVCLTAESPETAGFSCQASPETLSRTTLGRRRAGDPVNLDRALTLSSRLGGHFVTGHVDTTGRVRSFERAGNSWILLVDAPDSLLPLCVEKGSIAVDGISLTIASLDKDGFGCAIVPHTHSNTTLGRRRAGDAVNLEADLLAKHVRRLLGKDEASASPGVQWETLQKAGFVA